MESYTYECDGNVLTDTKQSWQTNAWVNYNKDTNRDHAYYNPITDLSQVWVSNAWVNENLNTYTYSANGNILTYLYQDCISNAWSNSSLDTYTYDANSNLISDIYQLWNSSAWMDYSKITYVYDKHMETALVAHFILLAQITNGNAIAGSNGNFLELYSIINNTGSKGKLQLKGCCADSEVLKVIHILLIVFRLFGNLFTGINQLTNSKQQFSIYPNPSSGFFNLILQDNSNEYLVQVYNVVGKSLPIPC